MTGFFAKYQLDIMLSLGSISAALAVFTLMTKTMSIKRRLIIAFTEIAAATLMFSDRLSYIYRGDTSSVGYYMVRIGNYLVFAMTLAVVLGMNLFIEDLCLFECGMKKLPVRLIVNRVLVAIGELLVIISQFTGFYYTFDEANRYVRSPGFIICYLLPVVVSVVQLTVVVENRKKINRGVALAIVLFTAVPMFASLVQVVTYGLSLTNISIGGLVIALYVFIINDLNDAMAKAHRMEVETMQSEHQSMKRLFDQVASAFATAVEKREEGTQGHALRTAGIARRIAESMGKDEDECDEIYYAAMLHDVGKVCLSDSELAEEKDDAKIISKKASMGSDILKNITEYPYLNLAARYAEERYDGKGYPEGLRGKDIPEAARIVAVAHEYEDLTSEGGDHDALPMQIVREEFIKDAGVRFDPDLTRAMVGIIDADNSGDKDLLGTTELQLERELHCREYRDCISGGILLGAFVKRITFTCSRADSDKDVFSEPCVILFDSYDRRVHDNEKTIKEYNYSEYAEVRFDGHGILTAGRNIKIDTEKKTGTDPAATEHVIRAMKFDDHVKLEMENDKYVTTVVVALPDSSRSAYIALTGEHCDIKDIRVEVLDEEVKEKDIERIADKLTYTDRIESDIPNIQIDRNLSAATRGIPVCDGMRIRFHTMSLPDSNLVWHCPYLLLFKSDDMTKDGPEYRQYSLIKLNGEKEGDDEYAENRFIMRKDDSFPGWEAWKERNKQGMECEVSFRKRGNRVTLTTDNLGIHIENTTTTKNGSDDIYVSLTGDQCALTDIRVL